MDKTASPSTMRQDWGCAVGAPATRHAQATDRIASVTSASPALKTSIALAMSGAKIIAVSGSNSSVNATKIAQAIRPFACRVVALNAALTAIARMVRPAATISAKAGNRTSAVTMPIVPLVNAALIGVVSMTLQVVCPTKIARRINAAKTVDARPSSRACVSLMLIALSIRHAKIDNAYLESLKVD